MAGISRRKVIVAGGAGVGLVVAWGLWPRAYAPNLATAPRRDRVRRMAEDRRRRPCHRRGAAAGARAGHLYRAGAGGGRRTGGRLADGRRRGGAVNALYANPLAFESLFEGTLARLPQHLYDSYAQRSDAMLTGGSTSLRMFEDDARTAGATARALLCKAAARRWGVTWTDCSAEAGFIVHAATGCASPRWRRRRRARACPARCRSRRGAGKLAGQAVPRIDVPRRSMVRPALRATSACPTWCMPRSGRGRSATRGWSRSTAPRRIASAACWRSSRTPSGWRRSRRPGGRRIARWRRSRRASRATRRSRDDAGIDRALTRGAGRAGADHGGDR